MSRMRSSIAPSLSARRPALPRVVPAGGDPQQPAHRGDRIEGPVPSRTRRPGRDRAGLPSKPPAQYLARRSRRFSRAVAAPRARHWSNGRPGRPSYGSTSGRLAPEPAPPASGPIEPARPSAPGNQMNRVDVSSASNGLHFSRHRMIDRKSKEPPPARRSGGRLCLRRSGLNWQEAVWRAVAAPDVNRDSPYGTLPAR